MNEWNANGADALRNSQERYRTLFDLAPIAVYSCDASGVVRDYNNRAVELWGRRPEPGDTDERFCGSFKMYRPDGSFMPHEQCPMGDVLSGRVPGIQDGEVHIERPDGSRVIVIVNIAPLTDDRGEIIGAINCFYDVTERKRMEGMLRQLNDKLEGRVAERTEELTASQKRLRALAAELNVTEQRERQRVAADLHDYLAQLLALGRLKLSQAKQQPMSPPIAKIVTDAEEVIDQALTYTRTLISQLSPPVLSEFGLPMALQWLTEQMRERDLSVSLHIKTQIPTMQEDQALLLFQSIRELLVNCVKHAKTPKAAVTLEQVDGSLYIQISDQGAGFDPLMSASKKEYSPTRGFGLLSIRERMLALGGRFELESSPGNGTTATLVLPLCDSSVESSIIAGHGSIMEEAKAQEADREQAADTTTVESVNTVQPSTSADSPVRVLVADDHAVVRQGLCNLLKQYGDIQVVGEAANGEEAVALAESLEPDVVVMDVTMPKLDGLEATRRLKLKYPGMAVIGLSMHGTGPVEAAMIKAGALAFINKEAAVDGLYSTIQTTRRSTVRG